MCHSPIGMLIVFVFILIVVQIKKYADSYIENIMLLAYTYTISVSRSRVQVQIL